MKIWRFVILLFVVQSCAVKPAGKANGPYNAFKLPDPILPNCDATIALAKGYWNKDETWNFGPDPVPPDTVVLESLVRALNNNKKNWPVGSVDQTMKIGNPRRVRGFVGHGYSDSPQVQEDDTGVKIFFNPSTWTLTQVTTNSCGAAHYVFSCIGARIVDVPGS